FWRLATIFVLSSLASEGALPAQQVRHQDGAQQQAQQQRPQRPLPGVHPEEPNGTVSGTGTILTLAGLSRSVRERPGRIRAKARAQVGACSASYKPGAILCALQLKDKFILFVQDALDPVTFLSAGVNAGISQAENDDPSYGQGAAGYGKLFGANMAG